ncbi:MAG: hypothetical protein H3C47_05215 [Candidatus Cloacimonetes bacterium]|nr:hypothetical protein [Candidatus Cloacimonadota bacterium]
MELFTQCEPGKPGLEMLPDAGFELSPISRLKPQQKEANSGNLTSIAEGYLCDGKLFLLRPGPTPGRLFLCWPDLLSAIKVLMQIWGWSSMIHPLDVLRFEEALNFHGTSLDKNPDWFPFDAKQFESVLKPLREADPEFRNLVLERRADMRLVAWVKSHGFVYTKTLGRIFSAHECSFSAQMKITEYLGKVFRRLSGGEAEFLETYGDGFQKAMNSRHEIITFLFDLACPVLSEQRILRKKACQKLADLVPGRFDFDESLEEDGVEFSIRLASSEDVQVLGDALKKSEVLKMFQGIEKGKY